MRVSLSLGNLFRFAVLVAFVWSASAATTLIPGNAIWKYSNTATAPAENWMKPSFSAEGWRSGPAQLGYGDGDEATATEGGEIVPHPITAYFRHVFTVEKPSDFLAVVGRLIRDDGAVVYLNGVQIFRSNMPDGPVGPETLATATVSGEGEDFPVRFEIPRAGLVEGANLLAVEVHQANASSSDISFALELVGMTSTEPQPIIVSIVATQATTMEPSPTTDPAPGKFTLSRSGDTSAPLKVSLGYSGSATSGTDYVELPTVVEFEAGKAVAEISVHARPDSAFEDTETVIATLLPPEGGGGYQISADRNKATVFIKNSGSEPPPPPPLPVVSVEATRPETSEPLPNARITPGEFTFRRTGSTNSTLAVYFLLSGSATSGSDYDEVGHWVEFRAGEASVTLQIFAKSDELIEGDETVVAELSQPPNAPPIVTYEISGEKRRAVVTIHDEDKPQSARVEITHPRDGEFVFVGSTITIKATAVDPAGYIPRVEFFVGATSIGVSEIVFVQAPPDGTPIYHEIKWTISAPGDHVLTAKGTSSNGSIVTSHPVTIKAASGGEQVVLSVETPDATAAEPNSAGELNTGLVVIKRVGGPSHVELYAYLSIGGSASNGVDFNELPTRIKLEAGQMRAEIKVAPLPDSVTEGDEHVVIQLLPPACPAIFPPPPSCYLIEGPNKGVVVIQDAAGGNLAPHVAIGRPANGAVFVAGSSIEIVAEARDPDGTIENLQIAVDGNVIAAAKTNRLVATIASAIAGEHIILATATDNNGAAAHAKIHILVRSSDASAFVFRHLPPSYTPGVPLKVELRAEPPSSAHAYAIEDRPPEGWVVGEISNDGVFDRATGKVKFGPFTDATARTLAYLVTPPATATGRREFGGSSSIDGVAYPIGGDRVIEAGASNHPGDKDRNFAIGLTELTAYAAAWKDGSPWEIGPNPIPLSYVTRAGFLWKHGETYTFDGSKEPPLCWVTRDTTHPDGGTETIVERSGQGLIKPGASTEVTIKVAPSTLTSAFAIEEKVAPDWTPSNISDDGKFDAVRRVIRWGAFLDANSRALKYTLTAPADVSSIAHLSGAASFDGGVRYMHGLERIVATDETKLPLLGDCVRDNDGRIRLKLEGPAGQVGVLQRSSDLENWEDVSTIYLPEGSVEFSDEPGTTLVRYYRFQIR